MGGMVEGAVVVMLLGGFLGFVGYVLIKGRQGDKR
jgi:hypothetical protein